MKIFVLNDRSAQTVNILLHIWERSVRATHTFLSCAEIEKIKSYVPQALQDVQNLVVAKDEDDAVAAFLGVEGKRIEMLFVEPERRGRGTGRALVAFAADTFGVNEVTVNEQNAQAVGFYKRMGFNTYKRTELDEQATLTRSCICVCRCSGNESAPPHKAALRHDCCAEGRFLTLIFSKFPILSA